MTVRIDSVQQWEEYAKNLPPPTYIHSRTHGPIPVPCTNVVLVTPALVVANAYNPNTVSPDKMSLLRQSIVDNGFCFPVVVIWDGDTWLFVIVDGFHRTTMLGPEWLDCDYIPCVVLGHDMAKRLAATWAFNKAKGVHAVDGDADVIRRMFDQGMTDEQICEKLGIDMDTCHRYKQLTGVAALFANSNYSRAWEMVEEPNVER